MSSIMKHNGVVYSALTPNMQGFHTAVSTSKSTCQGMAGFKLMRGKLGLETSAIVSVL